MIKFEEREGKLFLMLEEPVLLTPEAEMPCLVRLIQDDSPMGKHNKDLHGFDPERLTPKICTEVVDVNDLSDPNRGSARCDGFMSVQYYRYELIGTLVAEGSSEWRNYQLVQGKCVYHPGDSEYYQASGQGRIIGKIIENNEFNSTWNSDTFMRDDSDGWQLYKEQKPLLAYAKVGDLVKLRNGSYSQIAIDINDVTIVTQSQNGSVCEYDINGNHGDINGWHIDRVISPSEHIITIGCLSGTVEPVSTNGIHIWFHLIGVDDKTIATIRISCLDTQTRELVESLIKGQEEE